MKKRTLLTLASLMLNLSCHAAAEESEYELVNRQAVDLVWSGNYVAFDLLTHGSYQYIAYYDANRQLTIAQRQLHTPWKFYKVDSWYGFDSHNYITLEIDSDGYIHLLGNMHADRLEYFRSRYPHEARSLQRIEVMENAELERRFTYPKFLKRANGDMLVKYRTGGSGDGNEIYLAYNTASQSWTRLHEGSLIDGQGLRNAYVEGPSIGPDGKFHMVWIWRETPDASSNHDISYARSADLENWEDSNGRALKLPITLETSDIVDPVPVRGGAINGNNKLGFDAQKRPLVAFHKYDANGNTQVYLSRREADGWNTRQITEWEDFCWSFGGTGSLSSFDVRIRNPQLQKDGNIALSVKKLDQWYKLTLSGETLQLISTEKSHAYPPVISEVASSKDVVLNGLDTYGDELVLRTLSAGGFTGSEDDLFYLSWEAQAPFRGQARDKILPPSTLYLHHLKKKKQ